MASPSSSGECGSRCSTRTANDCRAPPEPPYGNRQDNQPERDCLQPLCDQVYRQYEHDHILNGPSAAGNDGSLPTVSIGPPPKGGEFDTHQRELDTQVRNH